MRTSWDTDEPQQKDEQWVITGSMVDDLGNSFRIVITTPTLPKANRYDLQDFMQLQEGERHKRFDIVFDDAEDPNGANRKSGEISHEIMLNKFLITVTPVHVDVATPYFFEISDTIGGDRAPAGTEYPYSIKSDKLYVRCDVISGSFATTVNNESGPAASVGAPVIINRSYPTSVLWKVNLTCTGLDNSCELTLTGHGIRTLA